MDNILYKYVIDRFKESKSPVVSEKVPLPFITISREFGCHAGEVATEIIRKLNTGAEKKINPWRIISKEILEEASKELNIELARVEQIFSSEERSFLDQILDSFYDKYYVSDKKISKTVSAVIADFARKGNVVIIGRGGVNITRDFPNSLHARIVAPLEWRIEHILADGYCNSSRKARTLAKEMDFQRNVMLNTEKAQTVIVPVFDITYNEKLFNSAEIADSIVSIMKQKGFVK